MAVLTVKQLQSLYSKVAHIRPRLLGLDVGTTFVGVALSDPTLTLALPQGTLLRADCLRPFKSNPLIKLVQQYRTFAFVVGMPLLESGEESIQCEDVKLFIHDFWNHTEMPMPVVFEDEWGSTQMAMDDYRYQKRRDWNRGLRKKDENAAAIILQSFLDSFDVKRPEM